MHAQTGKLHCVFPRLKTGRAPDPRFPSADRFFLWVIVCCRHIALLLYSSLSGTRCAHLSELWSDSLSAVSPELSDVKASSSGDRVASHSQKLTAHRPPTSNLCIQDNSSALLLSAAMSVSISARFPRLSDH